MTAIAIRLDAIVLDDTIQCRATINTAVVSEYAQEMSEGATFPPIVLFEADGKHWIGDGWHRVMASKRIGALDIAATVAPGGRAAALKHALSANAIHGHRRTNADKRRCVEIALREFPKRSSRAIAEMCGVSNHFVDSVRPQVGTVPTSTVTGADGKQYPARRAMPSAEAERRLASELAITKELTAELAEDARDARWRTLRWRLEAAQEALDDLRQDDTLPCDPEDRGRILAAWRAISSYLTEESSAFAAGVIAVTFAEDAGAKAPRNRARKPPQEPAGDAQATAAGAA